MIIEIIEGEFSVCKVVDISQVNFDETFCFTAGTDGENSLVCRTEKVPDNVLERCDHWKAMRVQGILEFSQIGILSAISAVLAEIKIAIFVISTYQTDYIFIKADQFRQAIESLVGAGYSIESRN